jgi:Methylamine utilisation protein MauE
MLATFVRIVLGLVLIATAGVKLARPATAQGLATFGLAPRFRRPAWALSIAVELLLGAAVAAGLPVAPALAAALMLGFVALLAVAIARGQAGEPCGCLGPRSRVGWPGVVRNLLLATAFALLPLVPHSEISAIAGLTIGLGLALIAIAGLGVAVAALARELGELRLAIGPQLALEIDQEGPALGTPTDLAERCGLRRGEQFAVAVFVSDACPICHALEPAIELLQRDPLVAVASFDEHRDGELWRELEIPGSPYAIVVGRDRIVRSKGTFNSFGQLEGMIAVGAERERAGDRGDDREGELALA